VSRFHETKTGGSTARANSTVATNGSVRAWSRAEAAPWLEAADSTLAMGMERSALYGGVLPIRRAVMHLFVVNDVPCVHAPFLELLLLR